MTDASITYARIPPDNLEGTAAQGIKPQQTSTIDAAINDTINAEAISRRAHKPHTTVIYLETDAQRYYLNPEDIVGKPKYQALRRFLENNSSAYILIRNPMEQFAETKIRLKDIGELYEFKSTSSHQYIDRIRPLPKKETLAHRIKERIKTYIPFL